MKLNLANQKFQHSQRVATAGASKKNFQGSGSAFQQFRLENLQTRHTAQITAATTSSEEFPWESMQEGGENAYVFPATEAEQNGMLITAHCY